jgi:hypothetical protein
MFRRPNGTEEKSGNRKLGKIFGSDTENVRNYTHIGRFRMYRTYNRSFLQEYRTAQRQQIQTLEEREKSHAETNDKKQGVRSYRLYDQGTCRPSFQIDQNSESDPNRFIGPDSDTIVVITMNWLDPFGNMDELKQIIGIDKVQDLTEEDPFGSAIEQTELWTVEESVTVTPEVS